MTMEGTNGSGGLLAEDDGERRARALELDRKIAQLVEQVKRQGARDTAVMDQLVAHVAALERTVDETHGFEVIPAGLRMQLVTAASHVLTSAIMGLEYEYDDSNPSGDVFAPAIELLRDLLADAVLLRVRVRASLLAEDLASDEAEVDRYVQASWDHASMEALVRRHGPEPSDDEVRAWLLDHASARRR